MAEKNIFVQRARQISVEDRMKFIRSVPETELHKHLKALFSEIDKNANVQITHGNVELGGDLLVIRNDEFRESIASVVVCRGDLVGETGSQIARITEQIKQCIDIPRETGTRLESSFTTEVWLVIAGLISANARKRLNYQVKQEYKTALTILNIEWLVKKFTQYYPEVFLGGEVLSFIEKKIQKIEMTSTLTKKANHLNLSEWFIEPRFSGEELPVEMDGVIVTIRSKKLPLKEIENLMDREKKLIVSGEPGVGKTTVLKKLEMDILKKISEDVIGGRQKGTINIPVMITAREFSECEDCKSLISKCVKNGELIEGFGISLVIIDGLDEVKQERRKEIIQKANTFCTDMGCNLIIGSRKIEVIKNPPQGILNYELLPFEISQALKLFEKLVKNNTRLLGALREGLNKVRNQLPMTPISLILLVDIAEEQGEVPASLADLYSRYFEMALGKWDLRDKGVESLFQYETKLHFLAELARNQFLVKDRLELSNDGFRQFVVEYVKSFGFDLESINKFIDEIEKGGIIEIREVVNFKHRSFVDYFAALAISKNQSDFQNINDAITELYYSDLWSDVAFFFVGIETAIKKKLIEEIMNYPKDDFSVRVSKLASGRLLQAGWLSPIDTKSFGIESALKYLMPVRDEFRGYLEKSDKSIGLILADFLPMVASDMSFGSITLLGAIKGNVKTLWDKNDRESHWQTLSLAWAIWRFLSDEEKEEYIGKMLSRISDSKELTSEEKSGLLLVMVSLDNKDKAVKGSIEKKLRRLIRQHPVYFRQLLPAPRHGFRRKKV